MSDNTSNSTPVTATSDAAPQKAEILSKSRTVYREGGTPLVMLRGRRYRPENASSFSDSKSLWVQIPEGSTAKDATHVLVGAEAGATQEKWRLFPDSERQGLKRPRKRKVAAVAIAPIASPEEPEEAPEA